MQTMMNLGYNNRWVRLVKDLLFVALCCWLISSSRILVVILGIFGLAWYGRDAYFQAKALWQEKHFKPQEPSAKDDGKITITNLQDVKDADFKKE